MSVLKNDKDQYEKYLSGKMSAEEAHAFERDVLSDPFEQEALEGLETLSSTEAISDIGKLQSRLTKKEKSGLGWMKVAAAVSLLAVSSLTVWFITNPLSDGQELAMEKQTPEENAKTEVAEEAQKATEESDPPEEELAETVIKSAEKKDVTKPALPVVAEAEKKEEVIETKPVDEVLQVASADLQEVQETEAFFDEESADDIDTGDEDIKMDALQGNAAGARIAKQEFFASDSTKKFDLSNALVAEDAAVVDTETKRAKRAPISTGAVARSSVFAPSIRTVSGKVTDASGEGLPGVNVVEKGTTSGTTTDVDGNYQITINEGATLVVSFIGFETNEVRVGSGENIDISLGGQTELQEVVVTGYGDQDQSAGSYTAPKPKGGTRFYKKWLSENLIYPDAAKQNKIEGTVVLELTISFSGQVKQVDVRKSLGYGCDEEAIRLVNDGPEWNPAKRDGAIVQDKVKVRVKFKE